MVTLVERPLTELSQPDDHINIMAVLNVSALSISNNGVITCQFYNFNGCFINHTFCS